MIGAIIFSRDRPMQLDLLLRSLELNGGGIFSPMHVIWHSTTKYFSEGYKICESEHTRVQMEIEEELSLQVQALLRGTEHTAFFTDDDVLYRPLPDLSPLPMDSWLCFSLRLGLNTTWCYPHQRRQGVPRLVHGGSLLAWNWWNADGDFGYPSSLDGHVFRTETLRRSLADLPVVMSPNGIEEHLIAALAYELKPMGSYRESHLVGLPLNRVNTTNPNRNGEVYPYDVDALNIHYLMGDRIKIDALDFRNVQGAHQEMELQFA